MVKLESGNKYLVRVEMIEEQTMNDVVSCV